jgi:hypothetical protein
MNRTGLMDKWINWIDRLVDCCNKVQSAKSKVQSRRALPFLAFVRNFEPRLPIVAFRLFDAKSWTLGTELWTLDFGPWTA